jgi:hypothetical protein
MSTRRRMVGECVEGAMVPRALAFDTVTNSITRLIGPMGAGAAYQVVGLAGAYAISALVFLIAIILVAGLEYQQKSRRIVLSDVPRDLAEAFAFARGHAIIGGVLAVTIAMNLLGFCYYALVAPIARQVFMVSPTLTGMLAGAEAFGALLGGLWLTGGGPRLSGRTLMVGGSLLFLVCVILMPFAPTFALACILLVTGGIGSAAFANMQTSLDRTACATVYPFAVDGAVDGVHRHGSGGHSADRCAGRHVRPAARRGHHGRDRTGRGERDRAGMAAQRSSAGGDGPAALATED